MNVRRAISHAINYEEIITRVERGTVGRIKGLIPKGTLGYSPDLPGYAYDVAKAKALMKASGFPGRVDKHKDIFRRETGGGRKEDQNYGGNENQSEFIERVSGPCLEMLRVVAERIIQT